MKILYPLTSIIRGASTNFNRLNNQNTGHFIRPTQIFGPNLCPTHDVDSFRGGQSEL